MNNNKTDYCTRRMQYTHHPHISENPNLKLTIDNRTVTASWKQHFTTQQPMYYEVSAGTTFGGADIIQWQETQNSFQPGQQNENNSIKNK
jgi:hypothetical protein